MSVRLRVAPSPTGSPHVGTAYVAILNLAFARQQGGQFILRIEDTDQTRSEARYETMIFDALRWLGLDWDEGPDKGGPCGPYRQSERTAIYQEHAQMLLDKGAAYYCFCTADRLSALREEQQRTKSSVLGYDRHCRSLAADEVQANLAAGLPKVVRLAIPESGEVTFTDLVRGSITIANATIDDQVLIKTDGFPTYHLASVVDDHLMKITHVMRAEEWITSTPKHILLYRAFGWEAPQFGHLPLLRNADRSKISKRKNPVALEWYKEQGYLPEAMVNFLGLMGYSMPDDREIFGFDDLKEAFRFERINPAGPVFDLEKLAWINGQYLRSLPVETVRERLVAFGVPAGQLDLVDAMLPQIIERMRKLSDFADITDYFFADPSYPEPTALVPKKRAAAETSAMLLRFADLFAGIAPETWTKEMVEQAMRDLTTELGWATKETFMGCRVAVTGKANTPPLVESIVVLGPAAVAARLRRAADALTSAG